MNFKTTFKSFLAYPAQLIPLRWWIRFTQQKLFLPFYHSIGEVEYLPHIRHLYQPRNAKQFEKDLDFLLKHYQPIGLEALWHSVESRKLIEKPSFFLSFDDGLSEVYHIAAPILKRKGIPATIFLNSAFVDNKALFYRYKMSLLMDFFKKNPARLQEIFKDSRAIPDLSFISFELRFLLDQFAKEVGLNFDDFLEKRKPYLSSTQIQRLAKDGFTFGGHSVNHPMYNEISFKDQLTQTKKSVRFASKKSQAAVQSFAFPFTDHEVTKTFFRWAKSKNYFDLSFGTAGLKIEAFPFHFQRFGMEGTNMGAEKLIKGEYFYFMLKSILGKHKVKRAE